MIYSLMGFLNNTAYIRLDCEKDTAIFKTYDAKLLEWGPSKVFAEDVLALIISEPEGWCSVQPPIECKNLSELMIHIHTHPAGCVKEIMKHITNELLDEMDHVSLNKYLKTECSHIHDRASVVMQKLISYGVVEGYSISKIKRKNFTGIHIHGATPVKAKNIAVTIKICRNENFEETI